MRNRKAAGPATRLLNSSEEEIKDPSPSPPASKETKGFPKFWAFVPLYILTSVLVLGCVAVFWRWGGRGVIFTNVPKPLEFPVGVGEDGGNPSVTSDPKETDNKERPHPGAAIPYEVHAESNTLYALPVGTPRAVAFVFHGCGRDAQHFFEPYPEDVRVTRALLDSGLAVVALQSQDRKSKCWSVYDWSPKEDLGPVQESLLNFREKETELGLSGLLRLFFGHSSGGQFVADIIGTIPMDVAILHEPHELRRKRLLPVQTVPLPSRVAWLAMENDKGEWKASTWQLTRQITKRRHRWKGVEQQLFTATPKPLLPSTLADRMAGVSYEQSRDAYARARSEGFLDNHSRIVHDPRRTHIVPVMLPALPIEGVSDAEWRRHFEGERRKHLFTVVNRLFCSHEMTDEWMPQMVEFLLKPPEPPAD
uniref:Uncharacterized protein n=1 Tax=Chromera velia CCMP2878 TaxID=1169474 RepID=A0A0G4HWB5_9ALVE|eukprot:Cvel_9018.t1-p1 / transcript=Cvel_9018.t1 / gene=Cvel_9018 / organism=Chromera_velia_CCMP2878 / gene_product=hypothetical protein / transcript_product=hypothetical protein / location=Cvel_scaffold510:82394-83653(+) / protein_length=420 / sequence_SO=supercontig / SO=protein_coding / is_pseudo=false